MRFREVAVETLDIKTPDGLIRLFSLLCGQEAELVCSANERSRCGRCDKCRHYDLIKALCQKEDWSQTKLNQALLLLNQPTVSRDCYDFFFGADGTNEALKQGVVKLRGMAMLAFGNFRFAFKHLATMDEAMLRDALGQYGRTTKQARSRYESRHKRPALTREIPADQRWYLGYISSNRVKYDLTTIAALRVLNGERREDIEARLELNDEGKARLSQRLEELHDRDLSPWRPRLENVQTALQHIHTDVENTQEIGLWNTSVYLTSDHLDVYVATSMRESWEFESTSKFLRDVFGSSEVEALGLRHFDPTLSFKKDRIDKGLIEGLMLKRADCTIYMIQETDTLGKDSELASTLAQGKPVIAYIPQLSKEEMQRELEISPFRHIRKRLTLLLAEEMLVGDEEAKVMTFLQKVAFVPVLKLVGGEESRFMEAHKAEIDEMRAILAEAENRYCDKRARDLMENHPLALQVHLETGVANGVLVVRSAADCAKLLVRLLTNDCEFFIEREGGARVLREAISKCPFRVVTDDPTLTNSFWSFYPQ